MSRIHEALKRAEEELSKRPVPAAESKAADLVETGSARADVLPRSQELPAPAPRAELSEAAGELTVGYLNTQVRKFKWTPNPQTMLFFGEENYAPGTEEFRTLRSSLIALNERESVRKLLVTSAVPQEGKSFVASNAAQILARQAGHRVLLIDGDLRWSRLHVSLGAPSGPGLTDYLAGEAGELAIIQGGPLENLFFVPGGKHAANPSELVANGRFITLLQRLGPLFDWVIVDSPPSAAVSDARLMAEACDGVLLVVAAGRGSYEAVKKTRDLFKDRRLLGVVLNRVDPRGSSSYHYYNYYQGSAQKSNGKGRKERT